MKYPKEYLDEIKTRLKVSSVVSKVVALKKRGKEFVGLSPFKNEKTPSFTVNDEKEFYHCFATSEHGNIFDFVMKTQNLRFGEAVKYLANIAGMDAAVMLDDRGFCAELNDTNLFMIKNNEVFEDKPLKRLVENKDIYAFKHEGFFRPLDTYRELQEFNELWKKDKAPWKLW